MRICHLTSVHTKSDTRIFLKECKTLATINHDVHFVVPDSEDKLQNGIQIWNVEKKSNNRFARMTRTAKAVYNKAIEIDADVYHFHDPELIPIGLKLKRRGKKVIYDIHEDVPRAILSKHWIKPFVRKNLASLFEKYENYAAKKFDALITATPFISKRFEKINGQTINLNNYPLISELYLPNSQSYQEKNVSYIGGISLIRGINQLLEAANHIDGFMHIAGPINIAKKKEQLINHKNIVYHDVLNRNDVKNLLGKSVAGIVTFLPEPNHINAQPNKMFEYMSAGIPIICSNFPLWKSIINKHNCGICVDPEKPLEIAQAINYLFKNPIEAKRLGDNGRKAVEFEYNWEAEGKKLIKLYNELENKK